MRILVGVIRVVSFSLVLFLSLRFYSCILLRAFIYFTFIKSVAINKDLSQALKVLPSKLDRFLSTIVVLWEKIAALIEFS